MEPTFPNGGLYFTWTCPALIGNQTGETCGAKLRFNQINTVDIYEKDTLHYAVVSGDIEKVDKFLQDPNIDINLVDTMGHTPLAACILYFNKYYVTGTIDGELCKCGNNPFETEAMETFDTGKRMRWRLRQIARRLIADERVDVNVCAVQHFKFVAGLRQDQHDSFEYPLIIKCLEFKLYAIVEALLKRHDLVVRVPMYTNPQWPNHPCRYAGVHEQILESHQPKLIRALMAHPEFTLDDTWEVDDDDKLRYYYGNKPFFIAVGTHLFVKGWQTKQVSAELFLKVLPTTRNVNLRCRTADLGASFDFYQSTLQFALMFTTDSMEQLIGLRALLSHPDIDVQSLRVAGNVANEFHRNPMKIPHAMRLVMKHELFNMHLFFLDFQPVTWVDGFGE